MYKNPSKAFVSHLLPHFYRISRTPAGSNANSSAFPLLFVTSQMLNLIHPFFPSDFKCPNQHIVTIIPHPLCSSSQPREFFDPQKTCGKVWRHFSFVRTGDRVLLTSKGYRTGMLPHILQSPGQPLITMNYLAQSISSAKVEKLYQWG